MVYVTTQGRFFLSLSKLGCAPKINFKEINLHLTSQPSKNYREKASLLSRQEKLTSKVLFISFKATTNINSTTV